MKLKNKLLPILGATAITAASIIPLATITSCKSDVNVTKYDFVAAKDTDFVPETEPVGGKTWNTESSSSNYAQRCSANAKIFLQDFIYSKFTLYKETRDEWKQEESPWTITKCVVGVSTPTFGTVTVSLPGGYSSTKYPTVSFTVTQELEESYTYTDAYGKVSRREYKFASTIQYKDVPFIAMFNGYDTGNTKLWTVGFATEFNRTLRYCFGYIDKPWSITGSYDWTETSWIEGDDKSKSTRQQSYPISLSTYYDLDNLYYNNIYLFKNISFDFHSYYLSDVEQDTNEIEYNDTSRGTIWINATSPWADATSLTKPTVYIEGFRFVNPDAISPLTTFTLNLDNDFVGNYVNGSEYGYENYKLNIAKNAPVYVDDEGNISIEATIDSGKTTGSAFTNNIVGETLYFDMPDLFRIKDSNGNIASVEPMATFRGIGAWFYGTVELKSVVAQNQPAIDSGAYVIWDGIIDVTFTYDGQATARSWDQDDDSSISLGGTVTGLEPESVSTDFTLNQADYLNFKASGTNTYTLSMLTNLAGKYIRRGSEDRTATFSFSTLATLDGKNLIHICNNELGEAYGNQFTLDLTGLSFTLDIPAAE